MSRRLDSYRTASRQSGVGRIITLVGVLLVMALIVVGVRFGPPLYDSYRFDQAMQETARVDQTNEGTWPQLPRVCVLCHGDRGSSRNAYYPSLAGQPEAYLASQLHAFASGERRSPQMNSLAQTLSDREIHQLAAYFAAQPLINAVAHGTGSTQASATAAACLACHDAPATGPAAYPHLAGQGRGYLVEQLRAFKSGRRKDSTDAMNGLAAALSAHDIDQLANYFAAQRSGA